MKTRRILSFLLTLCMVLSLLPAMGQTAVAADTSDVAYVNAAGEAMGTKTCTRVNAQETNWANGWYALTTTWYFDSPIYVTGTVNLILCDGCTLAANKGIVLKPDSHLIIWAQNGGSGKITADGQEYFPCIGSNANIGNSGDLTIHGGVISATGGIYAPGLGSCGSNSGVITISGGTVNASGRDGDDNRYHAPGIGASDMPGSGTGTINDIYFFGGNTTAYRTGSCPPIGDRRKVHHACRLGHRECEIQEGL